MEGGGKKENVRETNKEMWQAEGKGLENNCDLQLRPTHFSSSLNLFYLHSFSIFFFFTYLSFCKSAGNSLYSGCQLKTSHPTLEN